MASSKFKIKTLNKTTLFFNKHKFRAVLKLPGAIKLKKAKTYSHFCDIIDRFNDEMKRSKWYAYRHITISNKDSQLISKIMPELTKWKQDDSITIRYEQNNLRLFYDDSKLHKTLIKLSDEWEFAEADISPPGIMYFANDPPAAYRVKMKSIRVSTQIKDELQDYFKRTPGLFPNGPFHYWLAKENSRFSWYTPFISDSFHIDFDTEQDLFMFKIMYPEYIGKTYKLEKKP